MVKERKKERERERERERKREREGGREGRREGEKKDLVLRPLPLSTSVTSCHLTSFLFFSSPTSPANYRVPNIPV